MSAMTVEALARRDGGQASDETTGIRILIVDDHEVVRRGISTLIEIALGHEVEEASGCKEALGILRARPVDLMMVDVRMPEVDGITTLQSAREIHPDLPVLVLSTYDTAEFVDRALDAGVNGYLLKNSSLEQLREAIDTALSGSGAYLSPTIAQQLFTRTRVTGRKDQELSERETDVLTLLATGARSDEIAERLYVSTKTVKSHLSSIFRKLEVTNRTSAVTKAIAENLVTLSSQAAAASA